MRLELHEDGSPKNIELSPLAFLDYDNQVKSGTALNTNLDEALAEGSRTSGAGIDDDDEDLLFMSGINPNRAKAQAESEGRKAQ